jgi:outer membrane protein assembly factor BamB
LYFAAAGGRVTAIDTATGTPAWNADLGGSVVSNLLVRDSDLVAVTAAVAAKSGDVSPHVRSLSKVTGIVNWTAPVVPADRYFLGSVGNDVGVVSSTGVSDLLEAGSGKSVWRTKALGTLASNPRIDSSTFIVSVTPGKTYILTASRGSITGSFATIVNEVTHAKVGDRRLVSGDARGNLESRELPGGSRRWKFKAGAKWIQVAETKYGIAAFSADNFVYMLSPERGSVIWKRRLPGRISGIPAFSDSYTIAASSGENSAYVIELKSGRIVNQINLGENGSFSESPVVVSEDSVAALTNSGIALWSFGPCNGNKKAALNAPPK